jgi:hypothetical protein
VTAGRERATQICYLLWLPMRVPVLPLPLIAILLGVVGLSCLDLSWKEGIACGGDGSCPAGLSCCRGACTRQCLAPADAGPAGDGPAVVICPAEIGGCFACMPGCACSCGGAQGICCLQFGVATCAGCP